MKRRDIRAVLKEAVRQNGIEKAYLFGSFARGADKFNDLDIAIEPPQGFTLLDLSRLANKIIEKTGLPVDLVTLRSLHPKLRATIEREMIAL